MAASSWISLVPGNTRLHWALFEKDILVETWHSDHVAKEASSEVVEDILGKGRGLHSPIYIANVVPKQTELILKLFKGQASVLQLENVLVGQYETMGKDRVLSLLGAIAKYSYPVLIIDAGTALTYTGANDEGGFQGGAILPGLSTQFKSLHENTASLPNISLPERLPSRFVSDTPTAIQSGVLYHALAGVEDYIQAWLSQFPRSSILFTGGDGQFLYKNTRFDEVAPSAQHGFDPDIMHLGVKFVIESVRNKV